MLLFYLSDSHMMEKNQGSHKMVMLGVKIREIILWSFFMQEARLLLTN